MITKFLTHLHENNVFEMKIFHNWWSLLWSLVIKLISRHFLCSLILIDLNWQKFILALTLIQARTWHSLKISEKIYLICALISLILSIAATLERLIVLDKNSDDFTFALLLLWTTCQWLNSMIDNFMSTNK
jgi:hypothetical protein